MSHECHAGLWRAQGQLWSGLWYRGPEPQHPQLEAAQPHFQCCFMESCHQDSEKSQQEPGGDHQGSQGHLTLS